MIFLNFRALINLDLIYVFDIVFLFITEGILNFIRVSQFFMHNDLI
jgi:hypothetical protein